MVMSGGGGLVECRFKNNVEGFLLPLNCNQAFYLKLKASGNFNLEFYLANFPFSNLSNVGSGVDGMTHQKQKILRPFLQIPIIFNLKAISTSKPSKALFITLKPTFFQLLNSI